MLDLSMIDRDLTEPSASDLETTDERLAKIMSLTAVSYTHLDVYKRQLLSGLFGFIGILFRIPARQHRYERQGLARL